MDGEGCEFSSEFEQKVFNELRMEILTLKYYSVKYICTMRKENFHDFIARALD